MRKSYLIIAAIIIISFIIGIYYYPKMPAQMASHWNAAGDVNGYMPKFWGMFLMPIISVFVVLLLIFLPKLDPMRKNVEKFRKYFDNFIILLAVFLLYLYILTLIFNFGIRLDIIRFLAPAFAALFYYSGVLISHAKQNWFIGIRTPWTLSSSKNWEKTHKIGAKLFKISGLLCLFGIIFKDYAIFFILVPVLLSAVYLFVYSYVEFRKEKK